MRSGSGEKIATGTLVGFRTQEGFGFITPDGGGQDIMVRRDVLLASGILKDPPTDSRIQCVVETTERGPYATRVLSVSARLPGSDTRTHGPERMSVKFYNPHKNFGILEREDGVNVFLHASVVRAAGLDMIGKQEELDVWYEPGDRGFKATRVCLATRS
jgi:CspA family cold shock protein